MEPLWLDSAMVQRGLSETRTRAQSSIAAGSVKVNGIICLKASQKVSDSDEIVLTESLPFVGRGGYKLKFALAEWKISDEVLHSISVFPYSFASLLLTLPPRDCAIS